MLRPRTLPAGFIAPCLPSSAPKPPRVELWLHEIKHDGFPIIGRKSGARVRLYSRPGNDLTKRFPQSSRHWYGFGPAHAPSMAKRSPAVLTGLPVSS